MNISCAKPCMWMRVCDGQPMPKIDTSRYALDPPPPAQQTDPEAWRRAVQNAQSQLEHQNTRLGNLELLQQHGAPLWRAHLDVLDKASASFARASQDLDSSPARSRATVPIQSQVVRSPTTHRHERPSKGVASKCDNRAAPTQRSC